MKDIHESLSPLERKVLPLLTKSIEEIESSTGLDKVSIIRAIKFLENKGLVKVKNLIKQYIDLGTNGIYYKKTNLPERKLLIYLESKSPLNLQEATKSSGLSDNEFKVSLGVLKSKALIDIKNGKILTLSQKSVQEKFPEEIFIESLPIEKQNLTKEQELIFNNLSKRKEIVEIREENIIEYELTEIGKKLASSKLDIDLLEEVTPEMVKQGVRKKFRKYDITANVPKITGGKRHFVNQSREYARRIWLDMGFEEMTGPMVETSFWNFDVLFTPQDHTIREMQDSFFIESSGEIKEKDLLEKTKKIHEKGLEGNGWGSWNDEESKKPVLRTHTTSLSVRKMYETKKLPAKYFAIGKAFRNETIDWSHGIEFYQTEGIVIDENANLRQLIGYLKEFYKKMGFEKIRVRPSFFPYTEPSLEIDVFHPEKKIWFELGGAGIFRPEVTTPLLGKAIPVLAWGQGLDRIIMDFYKIKDLRELYANDIKQLREKKIWTK